MNAPRHWRPHRAGLRYRIEQLIFSDFAGSGYRFARNDKGRLLLFWTRKAAQECADRLNARIGEAQ